MSLSASNKKGYVLLLCFFNKRKQKKRERGREGEGENVCMSEREREREREWGGEGDIKKQLNEQKTWRKK